MSARRLTLLVAGAFCLGACSSLNPFSSSNTKIPALKPLTPVAKTAEVWRGRVGSAGRFVFQPAVFGDAVFAAAADGTVVKLQAGRNVWKSSVDMPISGGVGSNGRLVVVGSPKGDVLALDAESGKMKWRAMPRYSRRRSCRMGWSWCAARIAVSSAWTLRMASGAGSISELCPHCPCGVPPAWCRRGMRFLLDFPAASWWRSMRSMAA